jgi:hypothetical protein
VSDVFRHRSRTGKLYCRTRSDLESERVKSVIILEGRRRISKYQRDNINFPGQYSKPDVRVIKRDAWSKNLAGELLWSKHLSIKMLKHTEIYDYKFSVQAVTS